MINTLRNVIVYILIQFFIVDGYSQTDIKQSKQIAEQFLNAMYTGNYDRAKELSFDFDPFRYIRDINLKIDHCIERKNCVEIDSAFQFKVIGYREMKREYLATITLYECQFFYYTSESTYGMINILGSEDEPYLVNYVCLFDDCIDKDYPIQELDELYDLKTLDF